MTFISIHTTQCYYNSDNLFWHLFINWSVAWFSSNCICRPQLPSGPLWTFIRKWYETGAVGTSSAQFPRPIINIGVEEQSCSNEAKPNSYCGGLGQLIFEVSNYCWMITLCKLENGFLFDRSKIEKLSFEKYLLVQSVNNWGNEQIEVADSRWASDCILLAQLRQVH